MPFLSDEERKFVQEVLARPAPIWTPHPDNIPQQMAFNSTADVIGYGGAAGGGKTDLGIGLALIKHKKVSIFREDSKQLLGIVDRLAELLGGRDGFQSQDKIWRNAGPRRVQIEFGPLQHSGDEMKQQGRPKDLLILEEAANILEPLARFVMGWVRSVDPTMHCQTLLTFNPPTTVEGRWILDFFAPWISPDYKGVRAAPGELRWFATIGGKDIEVPDNRPFVLEGADRNYDYDPSQYTGARATLVIRPKSRTFIPSRVTDNPYLSGTGYMSTLQALPEPLRSQMLHGDFMAGISDDPWQVIPTAWVQAAMDRWEDKHQLPPMDQVGVDVARGGKDKTTIARRHGWWFNRPLRYPGTETPDGPTVAGLVVASSRDEAPQNIDVIGVGASPYDFLKKAKQPVYGINVAEASTGKDKSGRLGFINLRSQLIWGMRELLDPANNYGVQLPPDEELKRDLTSFKWQLQGMKVAVESREDIIKRIQRSPDTGTAYILASMQTPKVRHLTGMREESKRSYDPYENL